MGTKYFDYTASTPVDPEVLATYVNVSKRFYANPTSLHSLGERANLFFEKEKEALLAMFSLKNHNVVFTGNATEANNLALSGYLKLHPKGKIITSVLEHPSVYNLFLSIKDKYDIQYLKVNKDGRVDLDAFRKTLDKDTILVSVMWVNNILGVIEPIKEMIDILKAYPKAKFHVDMVQGIGKVIPDFDFNAIDFMTFSGHKLYAPKGIAGFFFKKNIALAKVLYGSNVQYGIKPGTFDVCLIAALVKAFGKNLLAVKDHVNDVREKFFYLIDRIHNPKIVFNTPLKNINYHILNLSVIGTLGETTVHQLEKDEIYVSTGSACASKLRQPEKTVLAATGSYDRAIASIRISIAPLSTYAELDCLIDALNKL